MIIILKLKVTAAEGIPINIHLWNWKILNRECNDPNSSIKEINSLTKQFMRFASTNVNCKVDN